MKKFTSGVLLFVVMLTAGRAMAQALVSWTSFPSSAWNATWPPTSTADNITVSSFTKGAGIAGSGTPAGGAWGGSGGWGTASAATTNGSLYFTIKANDGYRLSFSSIPFFYSRRSNSGPTGATVLYSLDGGSSYTTIATVATSSTGTSGTNNPINTLSADPNLQNIPSSTTVIFKIVPNATSNNWYINSGGIQFNGTVSSQPLPVTLVSFTGANNNGTVTLNWLTASETNNSHFEIEKSTDARHFEYMAKVASENSASGAAYTYEDKATYAVTYYRLKTVDFDGAASYSKVIKVIAKDLPVIEGYHITLNGNPVAAQLNFTCTSKDPQATYDILNMSGVSMMQGSISLDQDEAAIDVKSLSAGVYVLRIRSNYETHSVRFVKQ